MAGSGIKGITIEIGGNTAPLQKALQDVNKTSRDLQSELKEVDKLLKLDPGNTELINQKQKLLADSITNTKGKLETLKDAEKQVQEQFKQGKIGEEQYRAIQREVIKTEQSLEKLEGEARKANAVLTKDQAVGNLKNMGKAAAVAGVAVGGAFVGMGVAAMNNADELQRLSDVTGISSERLQELQYAGNNLGVELETITGAQAKLTKTMAAAETGKNGPNAQAEAFQKLGVNVRDAHGNLRDANTVMGEVFDALGKVSNETERDALSMSIFGKSAMELNPMIKAGSQGISELSEEARKNGAVMSNEAVAGLDTFGDTLDNIKNSVLGSVGEGLAKLMPTLQGILEKLMQLPQWIQQNSTLLEVLGVAIGTIITFIIAFNIQQALLTAETGIWAVIAGTAAFETTVLGAAFKFLTGPIGIVILAIGALIAIGILLYKNWDTVKAKTIEIWNSIKEFFSQLWQSISATASGAWTAFASWISSLWNGIVSGVMSILSGFATGITNIFNGIKQFFIDVWTGIKNTVINLVTSITDWIQNKFSVELFFLDTIITNIRNIFTQGWTIIKNVVLGIVLIFIDLITGNFTRLKSDVEKIFGNIRDSLSSIWSSIKQVFSTIWVLIQIEAKAIWEGMLNTAKSTFNALKDFLAGLWETIKNVASTAWNGLKKAVIDIANGTKTDAINVFNAILDFLRGLPSSLYSLGANAFNSLKNGISSVLGTLGSMISSGFDSAISFITSLPGKALQWGKDFIQGLIDGIKGMVGSVVDAVSGVAEKIRSFLHFSVPDEGPLTDYESWMPDFMGGLAKGIQNSKYLVQNAVKGLSSDISVGFSNNMLQPAMATSDSGSNGNQQGINIQLNSYLDGKQVATVTVPYSDRISGNNVNLMKRGLIV